MCNFYSGIILKRKTVLAPVFNQSHSILLEHLNIEDNEFNAETKFVRAELIPPDKDFTAPINKWSYKVDQDIVPDWYMIDPKKYEDNFREKVKDWMENNTKIIAGHSWTKIKTLEGCDYYLLNGIYDKCIFGRNNNYSESDIRKILNHSDLAKELKETFGDKLLPIKLDLTSFDGLKDYGIIDSDYIAIMNLDLYRECREKIIGLDNSYFLSTANSTPSGYGSSYIRCVYSDGGVDYCRYNDVIGVRPFFILKSSVFVSLSKRKEQNDVKKLTIEEAIKHAKEVSKQKYTEGMLCHANHDDGLLDGCIECGKYHEQLAEWLEELKAYKDAEENGLLLRLPCKVGDTVYETSSYIDCDEEQCVNINFCECEEGVRCEHLIRNYFVKKINFQIQMLAVFGKTVFLTKEEAEAALAKMESEV